MTHFPGNKSTILLKTLQDQVLMTDAETCLESQIFGTRNMSNEILIFTLILMYKYQLYINGSTTITRYF